MRSELDLRILIDTWTLKPHMWVRGVSGIKDRDAYVGGCSEYMHLEELVFLLAGNGFWCADFLSVFL